MFLLFLWSFVFIVSQNNNRWLVISLSLIWIVVILTKIGKTGKSV